MIPQGKLFAKDNPPFFVDTATHRSEDRLRASELIILLAPSRSPPLVIDRSGCVRHKIPCDFISLCGFDPSDFLRPFRGIFMINDVFFIRFKITHILFGKTLIVALFCDGNISERQHKSQIGSDFDREPGIRMGCRIGKSGVDDDELCATASRPLEDIHRVRRHDRFCTIGTCHDDILCIFQVRLSISSKCERISCDGRCQADAAVIDKVGRADLVFHKRSIGMLRHPLTGTKSDRGAVIFLLIDDFDHLILDMFIRFIPGHPFEFTLAAFTCADQRIFQSIRIIECLYTGIAASAEHIFGFGEEGIGIEFGHDTLFDACDGSTFVDAHFTECRNLLQMLTPLGFFQTKIGNVTLFFFFDQQGSRRRDTHHSQRRCPLKKTPS